MGRRGPKKLPSNVKKMRGTYRADRAPENEPEPEQEAPNCPTWLKREAKREWRRITPQLEDLGLLTGIDRSALAAYCQAYHEWWEMESDIDENGYYMVTSSGYEQIRPAVTIRNKALNRMHKFLREFGLSPSSRAGISVPEKKDDTTASPFAAFGS